MNPLDHKDKNFDEEEISFRPLTEGLGFHHAPAISVPVAGPQKKPQLNRSSNTSTSMSSNGRETANIAIHRNLNSRQILSSKVSSLKSSEVFSSLDQKKEEHFVKKTQPPYWDLLIVFSYFIGTVLGLIFLTSSLWRTYSEFKILWDPSLVSMGLILLLSFYFLIYFTLTYRLPSKRPKTIHE